VGSLYYRSFAVCRVLAEIIVLNGDVRQTMKQPHLSTIVQAQRFSLFGFIARMPDETDGKKS